MCKMFQKNSRIPRICCNVYAWILSMPHVNTCMFAGFEFMTRNS